MPSGARIVFPEVPHHVTQRGTRRMQVFLRETDYASYVALLATSCKKTGAEILAWCLMPNHVHFVIVPHEEDDLRKTFSEPHRIYARIINERERWRGHLWQQRFASFPLDSHHLIAAVRYIELNPVRARLCRLPQEWKWSSARGHLSGHGDKLSTDQSLLDTVGDWQAFLASGMDNEELERIRRHEISGSPLGNEEFYQYLQALTGEDFRPRTVGRPRRIP
ncbi:MAG: transposase [bacterium]